MPASASRLLLRLIQPAEVLEHHAPLLGRETGQLVPRGVADFRTGAGRSGGERGRNVDAVTRSGAAGALLLVIRLVAGETTAGIEQLERLLEAGSRLRAGDSLRRPHQRVRGRVERIERLLRERRGVGGIGIALLELLARLFHLVLRVP